MEAVRRVMRRRLKRSGRIWIRIFPDRVVTTTPFQVRMVKEKGRHLDGFAEYKPGQILSELDESLIL
jgi:large subunit ribosomal protein L16